MHYVICNCLPAQKAQASLSLQQLLASLSSVLLPTASSSLGATPSAVSQRLKRHRIHGLGEFCGRVCVNQQMGQGLDCLTTHLCPPAMAHDSESRNAAATMLVPMPFSWSWQCSSTWLCLQCLVSWSAPPSLRYGQQQPSMIGPCHTTEYEARQIHQLLPPNGRL